LSAGCHHNGPLCSEFGGEVGAERLLQQVVPVELRTGGGILNGKLVVGQFRA
jgi:hypothetical protein